MKFPTKDDVRKKCTLVALMTLTYALNVVYYIALHDKLEYKLSLNFRHDSDSYSWELGKYKSLWVYPQKGPLPPFVVERHSQNISDDKHYYCSSPIKLLRAIINMLD